MTEQEMTRSIFDASQYNYLSKEHSKLYDDARYARDYDGIGWAGIAVELLLALAEASRGEHRRAP
jgi:hypothetical protein